MLRDLLVTYVMEELQDIIMRDPEVMDLYVGVIIIVITAVGVHILGYVVLTHMDLMGVRQALLPVVGLHLQVYFVIIIG